ncbi:sel1 repeat family protein [Ramlibacter sp. USB13]|uniref:Sel1 repeat family protein n=1 Tax=Ramlibacter cellulosilyticus TaxID=2764187 RepID=A0A923MLE6_9BURK|nr:tetratricopeptide repeat protein [Ramlibacter cellulosilyticus]MBC5781550.1 sel1 repeat family protein [Ramlibacter cellulosilyticus]
MHTAIRRTLLVLCTAASVSAVAATGEALKEYELARINSGVTGQKLDLAQAHVHLRKAAELGHLPAQVELAFVYFNGNQQVRKDLAQSFQWFRKAAEAGSVPAQCMLGDFYKDGLGGAPKDPAKAFSLYQRTATSRDRCAPKAQLALYGAYEAGQGVRKDLPTAIAWLKKSADGGDPRAQATLSRNYFQGYGVPRDEELGRHWKRKSREGVAPHDDEEGNAHGAGPHDHRR